MEVVLLFNKVVRGTFNRMIYRLAKIEDVEQIDALCKRESIAIPIGGTTIVAENDGKIVGFVNFEPITLVCGFVSDNPLSFNVLYEKMETAIEIFGAKRVMLFPKNKGVEGLANKKGFKVTNRGMDIMEKML